MNGSADVHNLLLFAFWAFDKKPPKFKLFVKPGLEQFDSLAVFSENNDSTEAKQCKIPGYQALAKVVFSPLASSQEEQEQRVQLLAEQKYVKKGKKNGTFRAGGALSV
jgi:hypothetical protein